MKRLAIAASLIAIPLLCTIPANAGTATFLFGDSGTAPGAILTINGTPFAAVGQGWWTASAAIPNTPNNPNYFVGDPIGDGTSLNDFFTFDLTGFTGPAFSADLNIVTAGTISSNLPVTYTLYDVSTAAATLDNVGGTNAAIWSDLETGNSYGQVGVGVYPPVSLDIVLNAQALGDINAASDTGQLFSIGGTLDSASTSTPEPGTVWLFAGALLAVGFLKRRVRA